MDEEERRGHYEKQLKDVAKMHGLHSYLARRFDAMRESEKLSME